ncbi:MAG: glycosyltransferase family 2 protein [Bryobacterales bacterium]|nr:glycosyltransferase family 2 protein [Bryobacterales bacterium]
MPVARVTIGIPCYNCAPYLPALLRSLECQSFASWEAIAVDDASTDGTAEILRSLRHPRIRAVLSKENLGLGARLNEINELSQTEFIARTDADDLMHPERLARQIACFDEDPNLEVCATGTYTIDNRNRFLGVRRVPPLARTPGEVLQRNGPSHPTVTARRSWFLKFPYRPHPKRGEDLDLWVRAVSDSRMLQLDEPLHFIREDLEFDLAKYRRTMRDHRILFRRHRDSAGHALSFCSLLLRSYGKETAYAALTAGGLAGKLAARRNVPLAKLEAREVDAILARVLDPVRETADEEVEISKIPEVLTQKA